MWMLEETNLEMKYQIQKKFSLLILLFFADFVLSEITKRCRDRSRSLATALQKKC